MKEKMVCVRLIDKRVQIQLRQQKETNQNVKQKEVFFECTVFMLREM